MRSKIQAPILSYHIHKLFLPFELEYAIFGILVTVRQTEIGKLSVDYGTKIEKIQVEIARNNKSYNENTRHCVITDLS